MPPTATSPVPQAPRLAFARLTEADAPALAAVLSDPEVTRSIMAKATTPELLYGLNRADWGGGLATEAARATLDWAFTHTGCEGVDAVIFGPLNPGSAAVVGKLGMSHIRRMTFAAFLPDRALGRDVLDYELWRVREGACIDVPALLFQAPYKAGLLVSACVADATRTLSHLVAAAKARPDRGDLDDATTAARVADAFAMGLTDCEVDVYNLSRADWQRQSAAP